MNDSTFNISMSMGHQTSFLGNQKSQTFSFPMLKSAEILSCLRELQISIPNEALSRPEEHIDIIRRLYEVFIELCTGITVEEMSQPVFSGLSELSFPELHEESIPQINFFRSLQKLLRFSKIYDET